MFAPRQPTHLFDVLKYAMQTLQFIPQGAIRDIVFNVSMRSCISDTERTSVNDQKERCSSFLKCPNTSADSQSYFSVITVKPMPADFFSSFSFLIADKHVLNKYYSPRSLRAQR